jgi:hypothetical protein
MSNSNTIKATRRIGISHNYSCVSAQQSNAARRGSDKCSSTLNSSVQNAASARLKYQVKMILIALPPARQRARFYLAAQTQAPLGFAAAMQQRHCCP